MGSKCCRSTNQHIAKNQTSSMYGVGFYSSPTKPSNYPKPNIKPKISKAPLWDFQILMIAVWEAQGMGLSSFEGVEFKLDPRMQP